MTLTVDTLEVVIYAFASGNYYSQSSSTVDLFNRDYCVNIVMHLDIDLRFGGELGLLGVVLSSYCVKH